MSLGNIHVRVELVEVKSYGDWLLDGCLGFNYDMQAGAVQFIQTLAMGQLTKLCLLDGGQRLLSSLTCTGQLTHFQVPGGKVIREC